jgi:hypothetical protein
MPLACFCRDDLKIAGMDKHKWEPDRKIGNPDQAYNDERNEKGSTFTDTPSEADARDKAKVDKVLSGDTQKIDTVHPDELMDDNDEEMLRETLENK